MPGAKMIFFILNRIQENQKYLNFKPKYLNIKEK